MYHTIEQLYAIYQHHPQVFIDTRKQLQQGIFVAVGEKDTQGVHRGNQFAEKALQSGQAAYAIINDARLKEKHLEDDRYLLVEDGEQALQQLAKHHRKQLSAPIIAIAGSNGKTTTKELLQGVLSTKYKTFATQGNLNNHLGVPLSILSIDQSYKMIILEVGANHLGETYFLTDLICPDYGLVTNCGKDHLGEYGSVANIIKANKELYDVLALQGKKAFVCANDPQLVDMSAAVDTCIFYGRNQDVSATLTDSPFVAFELQLPTEKTTIQSNLFGKFWLDTLLNAAAIGHYFGVAASAIKQAIEQYMPAALRSQLMEWHNNRVLLDCYNANPSSMTAFLEEIQSGTIERSKVLVLGEMLELGKYSKLEHQSLVDNIDYTTFEAVYFVGASFEEIILPKVDNLRHFATTHQAQLAIEDANYEGQYIFVKGSRGNKLELIFE